MYTFFQIHGMTADKFHIIGHSLGAYVAGHAGAKFTALRKADNGVDTKISRITGLDPATG